MVEQKNKIILNSIKYENRIQQAILPYPNKWKPIFPEGFVLYKLKDNVTGNFYWLEETDKFIFVAIADYTGYSIICAMESFIYSNALTRAELEEN